MRAALHSAIIIDCMRYRIVDDMAEDEDVTRSMREREDEADIAEKTQRLIDVETDDIEIVEEMQT